MSFLEIVILRRVRAELVAPERRDRQQHRDAVFERIDHLGQRVRKADTRDLHDRGLAGHSCVPVPHGDAGAFLDAFDELDRALADERIINRRVAGRGIGKDEFDARGLELLDIQHAASRGHLAHAARILGRGGPSRRRERRQVLRHRLRRHRRHAGSGKARDQLAARDAVIEILLDELFHRPLPRGFRCRHLTTK